MKMELEGGWLRVCNNNRVHARNLELFQPLEKLDQSAEDDFLVEGPADRIATSEVAGHFAAKRLEGVLEMLNHRDRFLQLLQAVLDLPFEQAVRFQVVRRLMAHVLLVKYSHLISFNNRKYLR